MVCRRPPPTLTFDLFDRMTLKLVCESHLRWGTFLPNLGMLGLWVLELFAMYVMEGQTDRRTGKSNAKKDFLCFMPPSLRSVNDIGNRQCATHSTALLKRQRSVIWELSSSNCFGQNVPIYRWKYDCSHRKIKIPKVHVFFGQKIKKSPFSGPKTKTKFGWALVHDSNITQSTGVYLHATANIVVLHPILVQILPAAPACTHKQWQI